MMRKGGARNEISDGIFFSAVIQGHTVNVQLPPRVDPALSGLPAAAPAFTGRDADLQRILAILELTSSPAGRPDRARKDDSDHRPADPPAVLISAVSGLPGIGKTALAVQAAHAALAKGWFPGGALFVDLFGYDQARHVEPGQAVAGFLRALGVPEEHIPPNDQDRTRLYSSLLAAYASQDRPILVVVDNAASRAQAEPLLPTDGTTAAIVTSRDTLGMLKATLLDLDVLQPEAGADMLDRALRVARPGDTRVSDHADDAAAVAQLCGGLPLALQITAALLAEDPNRPLQALKTDLRGERTRLDELQYDDVAVRAAFDLSYRRLDPSHARLFRLLSLNPGPDISTEAAIVLAQIDRATLVKRLDVLVKAIPQRPRMYPTLTRLTAADLSATRRGLEALARTHLIERGTGYGRWRMHDLVRLFAREHGREEASQDNRNLTFHVLLLYYLAAASAASAHLDHSIPEPAGWGFPDPSEAVKWLDAEYPNLIAAAHSAGGSKTYDQVALHLPRALLYIMDRRRRFEDAVAVDEIALRAARRLHDRYGEGVVLRNLGGTLLQLRRYDEALPALRKAVQIYHESGDRFGEGTALGNLGGALVQVRRFSEAIPLLQKAVRIHRDSGALYSEGLALSNLGGALIQAGRLDEAITTLREATQIHRRVPDQDAQAMAMDNLGNALRLAGRANEAIAVCRRAIKMHGQIGDQHGEARSRTNLATSLASAGRFGEAIAASQDALAAFRSEGDQFNQGEALTTLGYSLTGAGRTDESIAVLREAAQIFSDLGAQYDEGMALRYLMSALTDAARFDEAIATGRGAAQLFEAAGDEQSHSAAQALLSGMQEAEAKLHL